MLRKTARKKPGEKSKITTRINITRGNEIIAK